MSNDIHGRAKYSRGAAALLTALVAACAIDHPTSPDTGRPAQSVGAAEGTANSAAALPPNKLAKRFAYVWAHAPTSPSYAPYPAYSFNATGGSILITRGGPGSYTVTFSSPIGWAGSTLGFATTTYGSSTVDCQMRNNLVNGSLLSVYVFCHDRLTEVLTDSRFNLLVVGSGSLLPRSAFAWADNSTGVSYTPSPLYSYTSGPGPIHVTHSPVSHVYHVDLGTGTTMHSTVLVNVPSGNVVTGTNLCKVGNWQTQSVVVRCFNRTGAPMNNYYWVLQVQGGRTGKRLGFAYANNLSATSYTPNPNYSSNSSGGAIIAMRSNVGRYTIDFAGLQTLPGHTENVQVTPVGADASTCKVQGWGSTATAFRVSVECRTLNGNFVDSRYNVLVIE